MEYRSNSIMAFIPKNKDGELILNQALFFQQALGMRIFVMNTIKKGPGILRKFSANKLEIRTKEELDKLYHFVKESINKEIPREIILKVKPRTILSLLLNESQKGGYEFVVVDKSNGDFEGSLSRGEVDQIISKSHCPVLTIHKDHPVEKINTIVIPINISKTPKKRLYWATFFAKKFNARIKIVSALNIDMEATKSLAFKNAEKIKKMLSERGVKCDVEILKVHKEASYKVLLQYIEKEKPELVIIRTHQEYQFSGKKIGKFVSEIVHGCTVPVFTVGGPTKDLPLKF